MPKPRTQAPAQATMTPPYSIEEMDHFGQAAMDYLCTAGWLCQWLSPVKSPREFDASIKRLVNAWEAFKKENGDADYWQ